MSNTARVLNQIATGDHVSLEINGQPGVYEGTVTARGRDAMTVALDELRGQEVVQGSRRLGVRFSSVDYVTVRKAPQPARCTLHPAFEASYCPTCGTAVVIS